MRLLLLILTLVTCALSADAPAAPPAAVDVFKQGDCKRAIPLLQAAVAQSPKDVVLRASLLSALVYEGRVDDAADAADAGQTDFPDAPEMLTARGEYAFYMGDVYRADELFKQAIGKKENGRACYGLSRIAHMASNYRTARLLCFRAHQLDPDDALITQLFLNYVPEGRREPQFSEFVAAHPWLYAEGERKRKTGETLHAQLNGDVAFEPEGERKEVTLKLRPLLYAQHREYGVGLELSLNNGRKLVLLLDTGASGILLSQKAVDKAGLAHVGSFDSWGIGDDGKRGTIAAISDTCEVEELAFKHCVVQALEGKHTIDPNSDGLIGADVFDDYLIELDFQRHTMHLTPLPKREPNPQGYDRTVPEDEKDFTPVFRAGDHLFIPTLLNKSSRGLFLIDTGASLSNVDATFARLSTKVRGNYSETVRGISGEVKQVFEADKAVLQFARYQQDNLGLISFNLNNRPQHEEFRMSGILGMPVLSMFRLGIDYRNGLVKFDYILGENKRRKKE